MRRGIDGDENAYRELLTAVAAGLRATVRRGLAEAGHGNSDIEDVVQETLLALHLKRHTWNRSERIGPWVAAIARYKLIDALRRRGRQQLVPLETAGEELSASATEQSHDSHDDVHRLLDHLNGRQRAIVHMVSIEGRTCHQAGQTLVMTEVAVRVALHRALKDLAKRVRPRIARAARIRNAVQPSQEPRSKRIAQPT